MLGAGFVLLGGLVAAVTEPLELAKGSWLAAYLVLVCGVPHYLIGRVVAQFQVERAGWVLLATWDLGNVAVVVGTLTAAPYIVDTGGLILLVPLLFLLWIVTRRKRGQGVATGRREAVWRWMLAVFIIALIVSIPVGLVLAHLRAA